jgi:AraC-like DNA-binding protein
MTANTVREGLQLAVLFASTRSPSIGLSLHSDGDTSSLVVEELEPLPPLFRRLIVSALLVSIIQLAPDMVGSHAPYYVIECGFPDSGYRPSGDANVTIRFDAPAHRLVAPTSYLDMPLLGADRCASLLAREQLERELVTLDRRSTTNRLRRMLAGKDRIESLEEIALAIKMSPRTLKRKLAEEGRTYSQIREEHLRQRALALLDNRQLTVGVVATSLGYSELANFTRAFRKWTGMTPHAYRSRLEARR